MKVKRMLLPSFLGNLGFYQKNIEESVDRFINGLVELANERVVSSEMGVTIAKGNEEDCALANIKSGAGCARLVQSWQMNSEHQLEAVITVERQQRDKYDVIFWEPVMHVFAPVNSSLYFNGEDGRVVVTREHRASSLDFYDFIQMALVGIISGPLYCK